MNPIRISSLSLLFIICLAGNGGPPADAARAKSSRVAGIVMDVNDARVVRALVHFESNGSTVSVHTDGAGAFEVVLPVSRGPYTYTVDAAGFCKFYGELRGIRPGRTDALNIHLEVYTREDGPCSKRFMGPTPAPN